MKNKPHFLPYPTVAFAHYRPLVLGSRQRPPLTKPTPQIPWIKWLIEAIAQKPWERWLFQVVAFLRGGQSLTRFIHALYFFYRAKPTNKMEIKMNQDRRKQIDEAAGMLQDALALIEQIRDEEQESFDNMPESLQQSDRGTASEAAAEELEDAAGNLQYVIDGIENAKGE